MKARTEIIMRTSMIVVFLALDRFCIKLCTLLLLKIASVLVMYMTEASALGKESTDVHQFTTRKQ